MKLIAHLLVNTLAFYVVAYIVPGVSYNRLETLLVVAIIWGILSAIVKPILTFLTLPINLMTLGLFTFVINAFLLLLTSRIVPGFAIASFTTALIAAIVLSLVNLFLGVLVRD